MIKSIKKLLFVLVLFLIPYMNVFAATYTFVSEDEANNLEQRHIFFVNKFDIDNGIISLDGFSFISHRNNLGYSDGKGNLRTAIIIYKGEWNDDYAKKSKCENSENCYFKYMKVNSEWDMSYSRCTLSSDNGGCKNNINNSLELAKNNEYITTDATKFCKKGDSYGGCLYANVGFNGNIDLDAVYNKFGQSNTHFKIVSYITNEHYNNAENIKVYVSNLAVYSGSGVCKVDGKNCTVNSEMESGMFGFKIGELSNEVVLDAQAASGLLYDSSSGKYRTVSVQVPNGTKKIYFLYTGTHEFSGGGVSNTGKYSVLKIAEPVDVTKDGVKYKNWRIQLDSKYTEQYVTSQYSLYTAFRIIPDNNGSVCDQVDGWCDFYTGISNVILSGNFSMEIRKRIEEITCDDLNTKNISENTELNINCGNSGTFYQCYGDKPNEKLQITGKIYFKMSDADLEKIGSCKNNSSYYKERNGEYYLPVDVTARILIEQKGVFNFTGLTPNTVKAGKGFSINANTDYDGDGVGDITYENRIKWVVADKIASTKMPYYLYAGTKYIEESNSCVKDTSFNVYDLVNDPRVNDKDVKDNDFLYYYSSADRWIDGNIRGASMGAISYELKGKSGVSSYFFNSDTNDTNDVDDKIGFKSCDSNSSSVSCSSSSVNGIWREFKHWDDEAIGDDIYNVVFKNNPSFVEGIAYGIYFTRTYVYNLPYAYVALSDDTTYNGKSYNAGDVVYSTSEITNPGNSNLYYVGNRYFVGFKYIYDKQNGYDFPFSLANDINPSLVSLMNWKLNGTCGVEVEDGYYECPVGDCDDGGLDLTYKYRSISLNNPFPKANADFSNIAINWKDWWKNSATNRNRINKTYENGVKYSTTISKYNINGTLSISDIVNCGTNNICSSSYGSLSKINNKGTSNFVRTKIDTNQGTANYCGLGFFATVCDVYN